MKLKCTCGNFIFNELFILNSFGGTVYEKNEPQIKIYECIKCYAKYKLEVNNIKDAIVTYKLEELGEE